MHDITPVIVGLSARVPGARGNAQMWDVLANGRCTITTVDTRLFDTARYFDPHKTRRGKTYSIAAGQLENLYHFDAGFFGITPREADQMDPQQRLMLQSVWDAVADAGVNIRDLAGDRTGVFVGSSLVEGLTLSYYDPARTDSTFILGNTLAVIANRISSVFDFRGPSLVVDTACASSLYALNLAAEALCRDELDTAIVGGVHMVRTPGGYVMFSQARMMSATGLCRAFDASADGYVRSEASVALVLQRPEVAARMGGRRRARVLASGVNTDGGTSRLTVPSGPQQTALLDRVILNSGVDPDDFAFFEAHGTGTPVGDPIEAGSIGSAVGQLRRTPLLIGSSKTNFGHSEPASGLVALAKTLLAFEHRLLPASLHFNAANPTIDFEGLNLSVNATPHALPDDGTLIAGVNSFGFGGTNASVIVASEAPESPVTAPPIKGAGWLFVSAASERALQLLAGRWAARLDRAGMTQRADLAAAAGRQPFLSTRLAVPLDQNTPHALRRIAAGEADDRVIAGRTQLHNPRMVFAFAGNGTQVVGMGRTEYAQSSQFKSHFDQLAQAFLRAADVDLIACLHDDDLAQKLLDPLVAQPLLFSYQVALARSLLAAGLHMDAVVGHSVGEIAALHMAGVLDEQAAVHIIVSRSRAFAGLRGAGTMVAIAAPFADVDRAIRGLDTPDLTVAAINGPRAVTVSGPAQDIARLRRVSVGGRRLPMVPLKVDIPYHSPAVDALRERFMADLARVTFAPAQIPVASSVLGRMLRPGECGTEYLWRNARDVVRFSDALHTLIQDGAVFLAEMSPTASFAGNVRDLSRQEGGGVEHFVPALQPDAAKGDFAATVARAWAVGGAISAATLAGTVNAAPLALPDYPWDETDHFNALTPDGLDAWGEQSARGFVGLRAERSVPVWLRDITPSSPEWMVDHKVGKTLIVPATALVEMALGAGAELWPDAALTLRNFDIVSAVVLTGEGVRLRTVVDMATGAITIAQRPRLSETPWEIVARGTIRMATASMPATRWTAPHTPAVSGAALYALLSAHDLPYGPAFRRVAQTKAIGKNAVWIDLAAPVPEQRFTLNPLTFDAALHGLGQVLRAGQLGEGRVLVPVRIGELHLWQRGATHIAAARLQVTRIRAHSVVADVVLLDPVGAEVAHAAGVEFAEFAAVANTLPVMAVQARSIALRMPEQRVVLPAGWASIGAIAAKVGFASDRPAASDLQHLLATVREDLARGKSPDLRPIITQQPQMANDLRAMMCRAEGVDPRDDQQQGLTHRLIWGYADRILGQLARRWRRGHRLNLVIHGIPAPEVLRNLMAAPRPPDRIFVTLAGAGAAQRLARALPADLRALAVDQVPAGAADVIWDTDENAADPTALAAGGLYLRMDAPDVMAGGPALADTFWQGMDAGPVLRLSGQRQPVQPVAPPVVPTLVVLDGSDPVPEGSGLMPLLAAQGTHRAILCTPDEDAVLALSRIMEQVHRAGADGGPLLLVVFAPVTHPVCAGVAALVRTMRNEWPETPSGLIAFEGTPPDADWPRLIELALRDGAVFASPAGLRAQAFDPVPDPLPGGAMQLVQDRPGRFETLHWQAVSHRAPQRGQVEIAVTATGVNFRDVMSARGILPERMLDAGATQAALGMECAGIVTRVGQGCTLAVGTRVMALASAAFANTVCVAEHAVTPVPDGISTCDAAALPVAFLTAWHGLVNIARLRAQDTVLIHGAAGGVGLAAVQIAKMFGARVLATAGSAHKRALAQAFGADQVFDSRSLAFADQVHLATQGRGVNVVLNSLSGDGMRRSVECLAPFGTFVELGKRDYLEGTALDLRPFLHNLSYHGVDLDQYVAHDPAQAQRDMTAIAQAFATGQLRPLPVVAFAARDAADAFAHMFAARHVGKIVLTPPVAVRPRATPLRGVWVLIGGTGGLGLAIAQMLLDEGAEAVHLVSRSGALGLESLRSYGWMQTDARVSLHALDGTDEGAVGALLEKVQADHGQIAGVMDLAMVLRDRLLDDLDPFEATQVIRAKLGVAQTLDRVLRSRNLRPKHVVFFSSIAAVLGNVGQAAYAAANGAVEQLAARRRADGLPGICIGWGPVADAGYLLREATVAAQLARQRGIRLLLAQEVLDRLRAALTRRDAPDQTVAAVSWTDLAAQLPALRQPAFSALVEDGVVPRTGDSDLAQTLRTLPWAEALALIRTEIAHMLAGIVHLPPDQFDMNRPLTAHGLDSLMAMEMRLEIEQRFGCPMPAAGLARDVTGARLAVLLLGMTREEIVTQENT